MPLWINKLAFITVLGMCFPQWDWKYTTVNKKQFCFTSRQCGWTTLAKTKWALVGLNFSIPQMLSMPAKPGHAKKLMHAYEQMSLVINSVQHKHKVHMTLTEELLQGKSSARWVLLTCSRQSWSWAASPAGLPGSEAGHWAQGSSWSEVEASWTSPSCGAGAPRTELWWTLLS